jgi:hypothetical protein
VILMFGSLSLVGAILILPGWLLAKKKTEQNLLPFILPASGIGLWVFLSALGVWAQSLSNLSETVGVVVVGVGAGYLKFLILDHKIKSKTQGTLIAFVVVVISVIAFRLFTPELPE